MNVKQLSSEEIKDLVGQRHGLAGFEYPENGLQPYYEWLMQTIHSLGEASAGWLRVHGDDVSETSVVVMPGRATIDGQVLVYGGGVVDLSVFNNDTAYVWMSENEGAATIVAGSASTGWPSGGHLKLAKVSISGGTISDIVDRRCERFLVGGPMPELIGQLPRYELLLATSGNVSTPSEVYIGLKDITGEQISQPDVLRVQVCDEGCYDLATNAGISAVGVYTNLLKSYTAGKDILIEGVQGFYELIVSDAVAETVTLRIGPPEVGGRRCDYSTTLDITHS